MRASTFSARNNPSAARAWLVFALLLHSGCHTADQWVSPCSNDLVILSPGEQAREYYDQARMAARRSDPCCVDYFYQAAICSWPLLGSGDGECVSPGEVWEIYHASVAGLVSESQRHQRLSCGKLQVRIANRMATVPLGCANLPWETCDFKRIEVIDAPAPQTLTHYYAYPGFGVPVVAVRKQSQMQRAGESFLPEELPIGATVILRPGSGCDDAGVLEFYNPLETSVVNVGPDRLRMARDITAPLEYQRRHSHSTAMLGFLDPDLPEEEEGLRFVEPYQPGKIPIVFVHGLLSDPSTWYDTANDLREQGWFNERYQIWAFRYASGKPFVTTAMKLRHQLREAVATLDPECRDPALRQMVLVGHSMGGLVSKLQVTESEERIWNSFASVPFDSLQAPPRLRAQLAQSCFFEPQPFVTRVVFLATPHGGSSFASRGIGRLGSALVRPADATIALHEQLLLANPDMFSQAFQKRVPTSMDMLEPEDPTLQTIRTMRVSSRVRLHSVIGTGGTMVGEGPGDGVVTVQSAVHPCVASQRFVDTTHTEVQRHPETQAELRTILRLHLAECLPATPLSRASSAKIREAARPSLPVIGATNR